MIILILAGGGEDAGRPWASVIDVFLAAARRQQLPASTALCFPGVLTRRRVIYGSVVLLKSTFLMERFRPTGSSASRQLAE